MKQQLSETGRKGNMEQEVEDDNRHDMEEEAQHGGTIPSNMEDQDSLEFEENESTDESYVSL